MSVKISELPDASLPLDGTEIVPLVQSGITCKADVSDLRPYKVYVALLTQSGTNAPVATVLENTLGGTVVWSYEGNGQYEGTLASAFTSNKTTTIINQGQDATSGQLFNITRTNSDVVSVTTGVFNLASDTIAYTNAQLSSTFVEIRVYP